MKICGFFGHRHFECSTAMELEIKVLIEKLINEGYDTFYLGEKGAFDATMSRIVSEMKIDFPHIKSYLILSYLNQKFDEYDLEFIKKRYDGTIYPPIENVPLKFAISKRNEWIVKECDFIIFYVNYSWGGAYKAFEYAYKKHKSIHNFGIKKEP